MWKRGFPHVDCHVDCTKTVRRLWHWQRISWSVGTWEVRCETRLPIFCRMNIREGEPRNCAVVRSSVTATVFVQSTWQSTWGNQHFHTVYVKKLKTETFSKPFNWNEILENHHGSNWTPAINRQLVSARKTRRAYLLIRKPTLTLTTILMSTLAPH